MTWLQPVLAVAAAVLIAFIVSAVVSLIFRLIAKREAWASRLVIRVRRPFRTTLLIALVWIAFSSSMQNVLPKGYTGDSLVGQVFRCALIVAMAWLIASLAIYFEDLGLARYRLDQPDNRVARRLRTQVLLIRRLTVAAIVIIAAGAILLGFPGVEAVGASVLASAGLVSVIAGLAAQSTLSNVFAGIQLAFSDALRVDDVVIVETQWGRIEEITLTYVVVHIWDDRRMVLPSTYFTTTPFESWTRRNSELLGQVDFDLDWRIAPGAMREELDRILAATDLWDKRVKVLQVTDAVGGFVHVRILVSAVDAAVLFDLRCLVREELVTWMHEKSPQSMPRTRVEQVATEAPSRRATKSTAAEGGLFTGEHADTERAALFTSAIPIVERSAIVERDAPGND
ncbi:small-conductance mechanosensitive channel [Frondihabitans sp. PhB188]|uniref:mechanosensitive ion channel family protein n=1 Tax=Frondihabitans sp. PhB188 TaxID=2485200 RepID=UPI000F497CD7|nr:mechanosensitive ion channel domain-containing protein [Frondihabitans sp. PhB188]ROQ41478.1 small-conductance mechanosensitive channel [Frondihabitans sp. PhB188]